MAQLLHEILCNPWIDFWRKWSPVAKWKQDTKLYQLSESNFIKITNTLAHTMKTGKKYIVMVVINVW